MQYLLGAQKDSDSANYVNCLDAMNLFLGRFPVGDVDMALIELGDDKKTKILIEPNNGISISTNSASKPKVIRRNFGAPLLQVALYGRGKIGFFG